MKKIDEWTTQQRLEAVFLLVGMALIIVGVNNGLPLIIVGFSLILLVVLRRYLGIKDSS